MPLNPLRTIIMAEELTNIPITDINDIILIILLDFLEKRYLLAMNLEMFNMHRK